jgi:hypothetical protein
MNNWECNFFPLDYGLIDFSCELHDLGMLGKNMVALWFLFLIHFLNFPKFEHKQVLVNKPSLTLYTGVFTNFKQCYY